MPSTAPRAFLAPLQVVDNHLSALREISDRLLRRNEQLERQQVDSFRVTQDLIEALVPLAQLAARRDDEPDTTIVSSPVTLGDARRAWNRVMTLKQMDRPRSVLKRSVP